MDELRDWLKKSAQVIEEEAATLPLEGLTDLLIELELLPPKEQQEKQAALFRGIKSAESLTLLGRALTTGQFLHLIENPSTCSPGILNPVLVGLPEALFSDFVAAASRESLTLLGKNAFGEPIEHHLSAVLNLIDKSLEELYESLRKSELDIAALEVNHLTASDLAMIKSSFEASGIKAQQMVLLLSNLLFLAWNSGRTDLIDSLSQAKEAATKLIVQVIGRDGNGESPASGLYYLLKLKLDSVFETKDPVKGRTPLSNEHPALEALSCLSLWYIQDYLKTGLIPEEALDSLDVEQDSAELCRIARARLEGLGIKTVGDLKRQHIYSLSMLRERLNSGL